MIYSPSQTKLKAVVTACVKCNKRPSRVGRTRCEKCAISNRATAVRKIAKRKAAGVCVACGKVPPDVGLFRCRPCLVEINRKTSDGFMKRKYGIGHAGKEAMYKKQGGFCAFCGLPLPPATRNCHIDHDHTTGAVRGLLHNDCNLMLGFYEKIGPRFFQCVKGYLGEGLQ